MPPICVNCKQTMKCEQNDVLVADGVADGSVGRFDPFPATYWHGDMYGCAKCGNKIVIGLGKAFAVCDDVPELVFKAV
jgi:hypothetical protein